MNRYYVASGSERSGPFTIDELRTGMISELEAGDTA